MLVAVSDVQMVGQIFDFIRKEGKLTSSAQGSYGADNYQLGNLLASLQDEGYTKVVRSDISQLVFISDVKGVRYIFGDENDLLELYDAIFGEDQ
jgi:hypothetical protein